MRQVRTLGLYLSDHLIFAFGILASIHEIEMIIAFPVWKTTFQLEQIVSGINSIIAITLLQVY